MLSQNQQELQEFENATTLLESLLPKIEDEDDRGYIEDAIAVLKALALGIRLQESSHCQP
jgi:hypothetical protein